MTQKIANNGKRNVPLTNAEMHQFYNENEDMKRYVDKFAASKNKSVDEILQTVVANNYALYLQDRFSLDG